MDWQLLAGNEGVRAVFVKLHNPNGVTTVADGDTIVIYPATITPVPPPCPPGLHLLGLPGNSVSRQIAVHRQPDAK